MLLCIFKDGGLNSLLPMQEISVMAEERNKGLPCMQPTPHQLLAMFCSPTISCAALKAPKKALAPQDLNNTTTLGPYIEPAVWLA